jgi:glutamine cyclotransferase
MNRDYLKYIIPLFAGLMITWTISCSGRSGKRGTLPGEKNIQTTDEPAVRLIKMAAPDENSEFKLGDPIKVILEHENRNQLSDSIIISFDGKITAVLRSSPWEYTVSPALTSRTGRKSLKATAYLDGKARTTLTRFMIILSDQPPKRYRYKVVNSYPHDRDAFTQGLFYDNGVFYEGTGQELKSTLREVEPETGKVLRQLNLSTDLFGEGITLYKDRIYQVTYKSKVGFVYDKSTFAQINKIYYQTDGWGLTTIKDQIVMSDGTNILYFFESEMFTVVSRLEVYDNEKKVDQLNELEYIDGEIWANIWMTDLIARIDPVSGKVLGYVDLKGILNDPDTDTGINVLNGIAWDKKGKRIFVTGKNWPKLFEIRVIE